MKRILIVGNSHVGAIKQGFELASEGSNRLLQRFACAFCATIGGRGMIADSQSIYIDPHYKDYARYSEHFCRVAGADRVPFMNADAIFLVGGDTPLDIRKYISAGEDIHPFSDQLVETLATRTMSLGLSRIPIFSVLINSNIPTYWIPNPCEPYSLNSRIKSHPESSSRTKNMIYYSCLNDSCNHEMHRDLYCQIVRASKQHAGQHGLRGILLPSPELLAPSLFQTKEVYSCGTRHFALDSRVPDVDRHMNAQYGQEIIGLMSQMLA
jgi:hypothetical protein